MPARPPLLLHVGKLKHRAWQKRHVGLSSREAVGTEPSALPKEHPLGRAGMCSSGTVVMPAPF